MYTALVGLQVGGRSVRGKLEPRGGSAGIVVVIGGSGGTGVGSVRTPAGLERVHPGSCSKKLHWGLLMARLLVQRDHSSFWAGEEHSFGGVIAVEHSLVVQFAVEAARRNMLMAEMRTL